MPLSFKMQICAKEFRKTEKFTEEILHLNNEFQMDFSAKSFPCQKTSIIISHIVIIK